MKRGPVAIVAAAAGFAGVMGFHPGGSASALALPAQAGAATTTGSAGSGPATASTRSPARTGAKKAGATTTGAKKAGTKKTVAKKAVAKKAAPAAVTTSAQRSATGTIEQYGYGQFAVRVTVRGTRITGLNVVGLTTAESYSQQLAAQVIPMLRSEVLAAQSTRVNGISGATYTAEAYVYSIQSALDKLHVK